MIFVNRYSIPTIERLRRKSLEKSLREITDAEIVSFNPNPLEKKPELTQQEKEAKDVSDSGNKE